MRLHHAQSLRSEVSGLPRLAHSEQRLGIFWLCVARHLKVLRHFEHRRQKTLTSSIAPTTVGAALAALDVLAGRLGGGEVTGEACGDEGVDVYGERSFAE